jgi:hypothetical protein
MTDDRPETKEARPQDRNRPDRATGTMAEALSGSDVGSDTKAGSLRGGSASGSDIDPDQAEINRVLAEQGRASAGPPSSPGADPDPIENTGITPGDGDRDSGKDHRVDDADAATG